jgi:hypothetical protein
MDETASKVVLAEMERRQLTLYGNAAAVLLAATSASIIATFDVRSPLLTVLAVFVGGAVIGGSAKTVEHRAGFSARLSALPTHQAPPEWIRDRPSLLVLAVVFAAFGSDHDRRFTIAGLAIVAFLWVGARGFQARYRAQIRELAEQAGIDVG